MLSGFSRSDTAYQEAVDLLVSTYGKKQKVIDAHLEAIFDLPKPSANSADLCKFRSTVESHLRGLKVLGADIESAGYVFAALVLRKLPINLRDNINRSRQVDHWDLKSLRDVIEKEIDLSL